MFATNGFAVAWPLLLVTAVVVLVPVSVKVPVATPLPVGAVKVTVAPMTGLPNWSVTVACKLVANAVFTVVLWGVPAVAAIVALAASAVLVRLKLAGVKAPLPALTE